MDVLSLLRSKNRCLRKFLQASTEFLASAEESETLPDVVEFGTRRDAILKAIDLYDRKISEAVALLPEARSPGQELPKELIDGIQAALDDKKALVHQILQVDDKILALIDAEKNRVLKDMASTQKQDEITRKFKSTWVHQSGEGVDEKL